MLRGVRTVVKTLLAMALAALGCGSATPQTGRRASAPNTYACEPQDRASRDSLLRQLDRDISALGPTSTVDAINSTLSSIDSRPCMQGAVENPRIPRFEHVAQVTTWWSRGGRAWLQTLPPGTDGFVVLPPDVLPVLTAEAFDSPAEKALVCSEGDTTCGVDTAGWALRAEQMWAQLGTSQQVEARCSDEERAVEAGTRYDDWRRCVESARLRRPSLPLGKLRAPSRAWFVLQGRRHDHETSCDDLHIYDLETGAVFASSACRVTAAQASTRATVTTGRAPVELLREAAWMTILAPHVVTLQPDAEWMHLPPGVAPGASRRVEGVAEISSDALSMSGNDPVRWTWLSSTAVLSTATILWPHSPRAGESYAADLWRVADASVQSGCVPKQLPPNLSSATDSAPELAALLAFHAEICPNP